MGKRLKNFGYRIICILIVLFVCALTTLSYHNLRSARAYELDKLIVTYKPPAPYSVIVCDRWLERGANTQSGPSATYWSNLAIACYLSHLVDRSVD